MAFNRTAITLNATANSVSCEVITAKLVSNLYAFNISFYRNASIYSLPGPVKFDEVVVDSRAHNKAGKSVTFVPCCSRAAVSCSLTQEMHCSCDVPPD